MQLPVHPLINEYLYELPEELIARYPVEPFDHCRMMALDTNARAIKDGHFYNLPDFLEEGDLLVVNNTIVEARRIFLRRKSSSAGSRDIGGARLEAVFLDRPEMSPPGAQNPCWNVLIKKRQRIKNGECLVCDNDENITFTVHKFEDGRTFLEESVAMTAEIFSRVGQMPIPPYLKREQEDIDRTAYQNPFLKSGASVAAPTASLHFTPELMGKLKAKGINFASLTLNIGYGTFAPLKEENFSQNRLHREYYAMDESLAEKLGEKDYNRLYAVGTTCLRVLETVHRLTSGNYDNFLEGFTDIFLRPPEKIQSVDGMVTNFHLPGSSLMMLVACLTGRDFLMEAYRHGVSERYRFFSYGDAMLIQRK